MDGLYKASGKFQTDDLYGDLNPAKSEVDKVKKCKSDLERPAPIVNRMTPLITKVDGKFIPDGMYAYRQIMGSNARKSVKKCASILDNYDPCDGIDYPGPGPIPVTYVEDPTIAASMIPVLRALEEKPAVVSAASIGLDKVLRRMYHHDKFVEIVSSWNKGLQISWKILKHGSAVLGYYKRSGLSWNLTANKDNNRPHALMANCINVAYRSIGYQTEIRVMVPLDWLLEIEEPATIEYVEIINNNAGGSNIKYGCHKTFNKEDLADQTYYQNGEAWATFSWVVPTSNFRGFS